MASFNNQQIFVTSDMSIYERINQVFDEQKIDSSWCDKKNLIFICEIFRGGSSFIILGHTNNIREKLRELYNGHGANIVNIHRLVDVTRAHEDWNATDFCSELYTCLGQYEKADMYFGFYDGINKSNILDFFDYKLRLENFNLTNTYAINPLITYHYENIAPAESLNRKLFQDENSEDEEYNQYDVNCVGSFFGCPEMTNGSQYCSKSYCPYEDNNTTDEGPPYKRFKSDGKL